MHELPIIAHMATMPSRRGYFKQAVTSLVHQVDLLYVYANRFGSLQVPFDSHDKVKITRSEDALGDIGDAGKFVGECGKEPAIHLTVDDDLIYPANYAREMARQVEFYGYKNSIVTAHGSVLTKSPVMQNFNYMRDRKVFAFFKPETVQGHLVDVPGTGVSAMHSYVYGAIPPLTFRLVPNAADCWMAVWAAAHKIRIYSVMRPLNWIQEIGRGSDSIFERTKHTGEPMTSILRLLHLPSIKE